MSEYELDENSKVSQLPCLCDEYGEDEYSMDSRIALQNQYSGLWAAEKWLLRVYLRRCCRFLLTKLRPVRPVNSNSDDELF
jgi:hypothetical protein